MANEGPTSTIVGTELSFRLHSDDPDWEDKNLPTSYVKMVKEGWTHKIDEEE